MHRGRTGQRGIAQHRTGKTGQPSRPLTNSLLGQVFLANHLTKAKMKTETTKGNKITPAATTQGDRHMTRPQQHWTM